MKIKFLNNESYYAYEYNRIDFNTVELRHPAIIKNTSGFRVYNDKGFEIYICDDFKTVYEIGEGYIRYIDNPIEYKVFALYTEDNLITQVISTVEDSVQNGILLRKGFDITFKYPEFLGLIDSDGIPNYKNSNGEMITLTSEEKATLIAKKKAEEELKRQEQEQKLFNQTLENKLKELSDACSNLIFAGVTISNKHYAYTLADQNDTKNALEMALRTGMDIPFHATNESCDLYTKEQMLEIYVAQETHLTHNITYHNQLKLFTKQLKTVEEIKNVEYGQLLTDDFLTTYNKIMAQAEKVVQAYLGSLTVK